MKKFKTSLNDFYKILSSAWDCYQLWWIFISKEGRNKYGRIFCQHKDFFEKSADAWNTAMIVNLNKLYETRGDTLNISGLIKEGEQIGLVSESEAKHLMEQYNVARKTWVKITILRSNWFAHQNKMKTKREIYKRAQITPNLIKEFMKKTLNILNNMVRQASGEKMFLNDYAKQAIHKLLGKLANATLWQG